MTRAVLDANVLISALISRSGTPARLLQEWRHGAFELIVSPMLLAEVGRALAYPKLRRFVADAEATAFVEWLRAGAIVVADPQAPSPWQSIDPADDYLFALAIQGSAILVSGDKHVIALADRLPIRRPAEFLHELRGG